jgi:hypothetical protein
MSLIRPEVTALVWRLREVIAGGVIFGAGLWLIAKGGYLFTPLGAGIGALGVAWALLAYRRLRFAQDVDSPGVVEVDEAQVGYLGPQGGGFVSIADLEEIRLLTLRGRRVWRLKQLDGQALLIPVDAQGAERLFDAFAALPAMNTGELVAALQPVETTGQSLPRPSDLPEIRLVWRRQGKGVVTRP